MGPQQFCLKWNNHTSNMLTIFEQLLSSEALVDVTLACDGANLKAHKMVLSACSPFFQTLFLENPCKHPIVILKDMKYNDLKAIIDFMYRGEVNVSQDRLSSLLHTAETLKVKGLAEVTNQHTQGSSGVIQQEIVQEPHLSLNVSSSQRSDSPTFRKRKRGRPRRCSLSDSNRSDNDEPLTSKIKTTDSLEILEDISKDGSDASIEVQTAMNVSNQSQISSHSISMHSNSTEQKPGSLDSSIQGTQIISEDRPSEDETEFEMEPSRLMEQTLTTDTVAAYSDGQSQDSCLPSVSNQLPVSSAVGCIDAAIQNCDTGSNVQDLVSCSLQSEPFTSTHASKDDSQDIKPSNLVSYEEPKISIPSGSSNYDESTLMMYMDTSGVPAVPGPSNYQLDKQSQPIHHPQGHSPIPHFGLLTENRYVMKHKKLFECDICHRSFTEKCNMKRHREIHAEIRAVYQCDLCPRQFSWKDNLDRHKRHAHSSFPML